MYKSVNKYHFDSIIFTNSEKTKKSWFCIIYIYFLVISADKKACLISRVDVDILHSQ